jgi:hypothetical protein|tara:strand:- start:12393 stop:12551 length:159 start_codon:yes stop_codon:yes gene_type:complete
MEGKIMIKNIIILTLLLVIVYGVTAEQFLGYAQSSVDLLQELLYNVQRSVKN